MPDLDAFTPEALNGLGAVALRLIRKLGPTTYKALPHQIATIMDLVNTGAVLTPDLTQSMQALWSSSSKMVATIDRLGKNAEVGQPDFDADGAQLAAAAERFNAEISKAELRKA